MYLQEIPNSIFTTTIVKIKYDCEGGFERCGKDWELKYKDAQKNFTANNSKHICRQCSLRANNPAKRPEVQKKMRETNLERYGTTLPLNTKENIEKRNEELFTPERLAVRNERRKKTCIKKYGNDHHMKTDIGKELQAKAMIEKYGVAHPYQSEEIMSKMKANNKEKYGVENVAQLPETRIKMALSTLEKYGVDHYNKLPEMKDYLREHCREWLAESWAAGGPNKGIKRPEEWNEKQSKSIAKLITDGEWKGGGWKNALKGRYKATKCKKVNPIFRSSLELMVHRYLDTNPAVIFYDYEPFSIEYDDNGKKRRYIPDFIVEYNNRLNLSIIEVKPNYMLEVAETKAKIKSAVDLCKECEGMEYIIWGKEKIYELGFKLEDLLDLNEVSLF